MATNFQELFKLTDNVNERFNSSPLITFIYDYVDEEGQCQERLGIERRKFLGIIL